MWKLSMFRKKISPSLLLSGGFFLVCMSLDFYITNTVSQGDYSFEANIVGKTIWELFGFLRYVEIPIWISVALGMAYIINIKSELFALLWLNVLAFNHLLGFLTWLPYGTFDFLYAVIKQDWMMPYALSVISIFLALPLALLQTKVGKLLK